VGVVELHKELVDLELVEMVEVDEECPTQIPQQHQMELLILVEEVEELLQLLESVLVEMEALE
jgi:NTP pyrophosphatase (non-canonical NTP hydrolase)